MIDTFGRTVEYLRLSVTDRCNLRCRYCMPEEGVSSLGHGGILSYEELLRIASAATRLGVKKIRVTGGEPLVRRGIVDFVRRLAALPSGPEVVLTTNGMELAGLAEELRDAGLSRVNVSLDTLREDRFLRITRREGLHRVLSALDAAEKAGLTPLKINMVPIRGVNEDEIVDFARLTLRRPWEVRFIEFLPVSAGQAFSPEDRFPASAIMQELSRLGILLPVPRTGPAGPARLFRYPGSAGRVGVIPAVSDHFCGECNRLRVTADGRVRPCLLSDEELDLKKTLRDASPDVALEEILLGAAGVKPERHRLAENEPPRGNRGMQGIGG